MANTGRPKQSNFIDRSYLGVVKDVSDAKLAGRIRVWIPELDSREDDESGWILCNYCSPFGGVTNRDKNSQSKFDLFDKTQTAYGMWMIPPDINNDVLVMFPSGDIGRAVWIGSVFKEYMNHSVPEAAYSDNNKQFFQDKKKVPVTEYNKWDRTGDSDDPLKPVRPYHETRFNGIANQGLIGDELRGITTSSSMRETPSQVFGINTPGPANPKTEGSRLGGHSFVMDDGDVDGKDSYIGFRTKSGASIRIDETEGIIYAINKKGTAWIQMDADGNVDIFGAESISMRTQKDFNVRADGDINLEAGQNVNVKASQNIDAEGKFVEEGTGLGGNINLHALNDVHATVDDNVFLTVVNGNVDIDIQGKETGDLKTHVKGKVDLLFDDALVANVGSDVDVKAGGYIHAESGADTTISATNAVLDSSGNLHVSASVKGAAVGHFASVVTGGLSVGSAGPGGVGASVLDDVGVEASSAVLITGNVKMSGNLDMMGTATASNFITPTAGLNEHTHPYAWTNSGGDSITVPTETSGGKKPVITEVNPDEGPGNPTPVETVVSAESKAATPIAKVPAVNVLSEFDGTLAMNLNNDNVTANESGQTVEIPDYWNRKTEEIETIVKRLATYEPSPIHETSAKKKAD